MRGGPTATWGMERWHFELRGAIPQLELRGQNTGKLDAKRGAAVAGDILTGDLDKRGGYAIAGRNLSGLHHGRVFFHSLDEDI